MIQDILHHLNGITLSYYHLQIILYHEAVVGSHLEKRIIWLKFHHLTVFSTKADNLETLYYNSSKYLIFVQ